VSSRRARAASPRSGGPKRLGEREIIALFERRLRAGAKSRRAVELGIGDDAAVLRCRGRRLVWTVDSCVEGVHFRRDWLGLADVGYRSLQAAASDLAAMGARPLGALSSVVVPSALMPAELDELASGQAEAAASLECPVIGGNLARGKELSVTTSVLGEARRVLARSGASPGEELWLVGDVGLAAAAVEILRRKRAVRNGSAARVCVAAWRRPRALLARGVQLVGRATAAIDVSDGLSGDATRLAEASGARILIEEVLLRRALRSELEQMAGELGVDALELALRGGEDYALLATGKATRRPRFAARIGSVERGNGVFLVAASGTAMLLGEGFDHFAY
jgi:thiamine-monophosphate kinase